jgi:arsenate reductase (glutaredoxin)
LLNEKGIPHKYREYTQEPLTESEIRRVLTLLDQEPVSLLRRNDKAYKALSLTGRESADTLIKHMAAHPTLLQRPIGILGENAVVGRPPENLLSLLEHR